MWISLKYAMKAKVEGSDYCITGGNYVFFKFRFVVLKKAQVFRFLYTADGRKRVRTAYIPEKADEFISLSITYALPVNL
jgi:hypothetical protein